MFWKRGRLAATFAAAVTAAQLPVPSAHAFYGPADIPAAGLTERVAAGFRADVLARRKTPHSLCVESDHMKDYRENVRALRLSRPVAIPAPAQAPLIVVIDPGHGGIHSGANGSALDRGATRSGLQETDIIDGLARKLDRQLREAGFETYMTRPPLSSGVSLKPETHGIPGHAGHYIVWRTEMASRIAQARGTDRVVFISLHADSHPGAAYSGTDVYVQTDAAGLGPKSAPSRALARHLAENVRLRPGAGARVREKDLGVLRCQPEGFAAVLVEIGQMNNAADRRALTDIARGGGTADLFADKIVTGVKAFATTQYGPAPTLREAGAAAPVPVR